MSGRLLMYACCSCASAASGRALLPGLGCMRWAHVRTLASRATRGSHGGSVPPNERGTSSDLNTKTSASIRPHNNAPPPTARPQQRPASSTRAPTSASSPTKPTSRPRQHRAPHSQEAEAVTSGPRSAAGLADTRPQRSVTSPVPTAARQPTSGAAVSSTAAGASAAAPVGSLGGSAHSAAASTSGGTGGELDPAMVQLLSRYGLSDIQVRQLDTYLDYMLEVNQSMNLTAVRDKSDAWQRHIADSLALLPVLERHAAGAGAAARSGSGSGRGTEERARSGEGASSSGAGGDGGGDVAAAPLRLVDVGTGAGLPGMVLAAARPHWKVTLLDSLRKRCDFLVQAAERCGLDNVEVVWARAEEGGRRPELRQSYDVAVARAVAEARVLAELCLPFVRVGGLWVAAKGPDPEVEVHAASGAFRQLGGSLVGVERVESFSSEGQRTAIVVAKTAPTPQHFPRPPGAPGKKPL